MKFRLGSAGEPTICSHCYSIRVIAFGTLIAEWNHICFNNAIILFIYLFLFSVTVNIEDSKPIQKKKVEAPKPEPVRVGDVRPATADLYQTGELGNPLALGDVVVVLTHWCWEMW